MYLIVVYDVESCRVAKMCKLLRQYLLHEQRSVFNGELTQKNYTELVGKIIALIDPAVDMCIFYELNSVQNVYKHAIGKKDFDFPENFL